MPSSIRHGIFQCCVFVVRLLFLSSGFFRTLKIFAKIILDLKRLSVIKHVLINRLTYALQQGCVITRTLIPRYSRPLINRPIENR